MELYSFTIEERRKPQDHIDYEELKDNVQALLLLASLPKSYNPLSQCKHWFLERTMLKLEDASLAFLENKQMM